MTIAAPKELVSPSHRAYFELREFGDCIALGLRVEDPEYGVRRITYDERLSELIDAMRRDLDDVT